MPNNIVLAKGYATMEAIAAVAGLKKKPAETKPLYRVQVGAFQKKEYADALLDKLEKAGFDGYIKQDY